MSRARDAGELEAAPGVPGVAPRVVVHELVVEGHEQPPVVEEDGPELGSGVDEATGQLGRLPTEEGLASGVHAERTQLLGQDRLHGLEGEVDPLRLTVQEELVTEMRALMIDADAGGEARMAGGDGDPDQVVGVDEVEAGAIEVELTEDRAGQVDLDAVPRPVPREAEEREAVAIGSCLVIVKGNGAAFCPDDQGRGVMLARRQIPDAP